MLNAAQGFELEPLPVAKRDADPVSKYALPLFYVRDLGAGAREQLIAEFLGCTQPRRVRCDDQGRNLLRPRPNRRLENLAWDVARFPDQRGAVNSLAQLLGRLAQGFVSRRASLRGDDNHAAPLNQRSEGLQSTLVS